MYSSPKPDQSFYKTSQWLKMLTENLYQHFCTVTFNVESDDAVSALVLAANMHIVFTCCVCPLLESLSATEGRPGICSRRGVTDSGSAQGEQCCEL